MKSLKESILNRRNIVSQGVEVSKKERLYKTLFDFVRKDGFNIYSIIPDSRISNYSQFNFRKDIIKDTTKDTSNKEFENLTKQVVDIFNKLGSKYKAIKDSKNYSTKHIKIRHNDNFYIILDSEETIHICSYTFLDKYEIHFTIIAPEEYNAHIS